MRNTTSTQVVTVILLLLLLHLLSSSTAAAVAVAVAASSSIAFQSGPSPSHMAAGGMAYDSIHQVLYVTGSTSQPLGEPFQPRPSCFLGVLNTTRSTLTWIDQNTYFLHDDDTNSISSHCHSIALQDKQIALIGRLRYNTGGEKGFVFSIENTGGKYIGPKLQDPILMPNNPLSIAGDTQDLYVLSTAFRDSTSTTSTHTHTIKDIMIIEKYNVHSFESEWERSYPSQEDESITTVGGGLVKDARLWVVGSKATRGNPFVRGFLAQVDSFNGELATQEFSNAFSTGNGDTIFQSLCDNPDDSHSLYVVGSTTTSTGNTVATLFKISLEDHSNNFSLLWTHPIDADIQSSSNGLSCHAASDGQLVYMAGNTGTGVFVILVDATRGRTQWTTHVEAKDTQLPQGGGMLSMDNDSILLYGETTDSLYRSKSIDEDDSSDLFLSSFPKTNELLSSTTADNSTTTTDEPQEQDFATPQAAFVLQDDFANDPAVLSLGIFLLVSACLMGMCWCHQSQKRAKEQYHQKQMMNIFKYLNAFDVDDVDIMRSPAGGYHGTYKNELALGINGSENFNVHASVAEDYLFMSKEKLPLHQRHSFNVDDEQEEKVALGWQGLSSLI